MKKIILLVSLSAALVAADASGQAFFFSTGNPDGKMAAASRPDAAGKFEIESGDDFDLTAPTQITSATFTGLVPIGFNVSTIGEVQVEIYRVFPNDSNTVRVPNVPTRTNSPSDVAFDSRNSLAAGGLSFSTSVLSSSFTAANSIQPGGIHPSPLQTTGGNGAVTGQEVQFNITFTTPFDLPADHYFFVPQVELPNLGDNFFWLSAPRPIVPPGTSFPMGVTDLQAWTRDANLDPDWLREGMDIVGVVNGSPAPTFNQVFSLTGTVPDSGSTALLLGSAAVVLFYLKRRIRA